MDVITELNVFDGVIILVIAVPTVYVASKITLPKLRLLSIFLASFLVIHSISHLSAVVSETYGGAVFGFLSDGLIEPLSFAVFLFFAVMLYRLGAI
ncbi:MAG: hypothetical protein OK474_00605 [Thaumarchaeota archaeon]|nr:hypothetical protein [Nitrososphaerota archaeon]